MTGDLAYNRFLCRRVRITCGPLKGWTGICKKQSTRYPAYLIMALNDGARDTEGHAAAVVYVKPANLEYA